MSIKYVFKFSNRNKPKHTTLLTAATLDEFLIVASCLKEWVCYVKEYRDFPTAHHWAVVTRYHHTICAICNPNTDYGLLTRVWCFVSEMWTKDKWLIKSAPRLFQKIITDDLSVPLEVTMRHVMHTCILINSKNYLVYER